MNHESGQSKPLSAMTLSMIIFGTIGIFRRFIPLPSEVLAFGRGIMGGTFLLLMLKFRSQRFAPGRIGRRNLILLVITGSLIGFNWILLFEAYNYTTVAVATLCYYMQPVIVILLSPVVLKEKLTLKQLLCVIVSAVGMILVSGVWGSEAPGSRQGIFLGLGAAVLYAMVVILNKLITGVPAPEKTIIQLFSAGIVLIPYLALTGKLRAYPLPASGIVLFLIVGILHTGIAYAMYFASIERLPARTCALMSYIDPVTAIVLSALLLHEPMGVTGLTGTILIIGSAIYNSVASPG